MMTYTIALNTNPVFGVRVFVPKLLGMETTEYIEGQTTKAGKDYLLADLNTMFF